MSAGVLNFVQGTLLRAANTTMFLSEIDRYSARDALPLGELCAAGCRDLFEKWLTL
jgi:hypothetical protein